MSSDNYKGGILLNISVLAHMKFEVVFFTLFCILDTLDKIITMAETEAL